MRSSARRCRSSAKAFARPSTFAAIERVLDVAAGNGNASLAAARRFALVVSTDYVGALLDRGAGARRRRAAADRVPGSGRREPALRRREFPRGAVDLRRDVHARPAAGGEPSWCASASAAAGSASPTGRRTSFIGQLFKTIGKYIPPAPGVKSPALWGNRAHLDDAVRPRRLDPRGQPHLQFPLPLARITCSKSSAPITVRC